MARSVRVDGRPLTFLRLAALLGEDATLTPVWFDVARDLPLLDAQRLQAWLIRRGIPAELGQPVRPTSDRWLDRRRDRKRVADVDG